MKDKISMIIFVLVLGSILTSALVAVDYYTAPRIGKNMEFKIKTRVLEALDIPFTKDNVEKVFSENIKESEVKGAKFFTSKDGNIAFEFSGSGLWGPIHGVMALMSDLETIKGITVIHQEETPGLGGRIAEKEFLDRFKNKKIVPQLIVQSPGKSKGDNELDGITGATLSCKAFEKILNSESKENISLLKGDTK